MVSKKCFYLSGETQNKLFGLVLSKSRLYISNEQMRLEGRWLGAYALLDISWQNNDPIFAGSMGFDASPTLDFGVIRVAGVKVADNVRITLALRADVAVVISKQGFSADVSARFAINGQGFSLSFSIDITPADLADLINWVKQRIIDAPGKYLEHLFSDAEAWLQNIGSGAIEFAKDAGEAVGAALKAGFGVTKGALADVMQEAGYTASQVGAALSTAYHATAQEATNLLKAADYAVEDISKFLKDFYKDSDEVVSKRLKDAGYAADAVGKALQSAFQSSAEDAARLLKLAGYNTREVGDALQHTFGKGAADCVKILKSAGFNPKDVDDTFKAVGKAVTKGVESVGKATEKTAKKAGKMFKKIF
jgi:hypothetical protein